MTTEELLEALTRLGPHYEEFMASLDHEGCGTEPLSRYTTLRDELLPVLKPLVEKMAAVGLLTPTCWDKEDRFVAFDIESVTINGDLQLNCYEVTSSSEEMPQFEW